MSHYEEEQRGEIEALESIYSDEFTLLQTEPFYRIQVFIKTSDYEAENGASCNLLVDYVKNYPDEIPTLQINDVSNLDENVVEVLTQRLLDLAEENKGMVMVFTLVSAIQEWLENEVDDMKKKEAEEKERRLREVEEAEKKKFEGTRVTVESFLAWKVMFDAERMALKKQKIKDDPNVKSLTGRQLFEIDHTLNDSDIRFIQEGEEEVKIDESLFQDMEDLDLETEIEAEGDSS